MAHPYLYLLTMMLISFLLILLLFNSVISIIRPLINRASTASSKSIGFSVISKIRS